MNKLTIINGSPKPKSSVSKTIIDYFCGFLTETPTVLQATKLIKQENPTELIDSLANTTLLLVFPLYIDSLPAPLIKVLNIIEEQTRKLPNKPIVKVYTIVNCGFLEAQHNFLALKIIEHFCCSCGYLFQGGLAIGSGAILMDYRNAPNKGPATAIYQAIENLARKITSDQPLPEDIFVSPKMPRWLYILGGNYGWKSIAKKRGTKNSLNAQPHKTNG